MTNKEIISTAVKVECIDCSKGVQMCRTRPCWGTADEFKKIISAGHKEKLMLEYYNNNDLNNGETVYFLCGASNGCECTKADWNPKGTCVFLVDNKCLIHDMKPTMGAVGCCKVGVDKNLLHACLKTWNTKQGKDLIEKWKKDVDYTDKDDNDGFSIYDAIMLNFGL